MIRNILVVCVGNICRSPMAEALLKSALREQEGFKVESAGLGALVGYPAAEDTVALMDEMGIDITAHRARQIHPDMVAEADLVLVMESGHKRAIDDAAFMCTRKYGDAPEVIMSGRLDLTFPYVPTHLRKCSFF